MRRSSGYRGARPAHDSGNCAQYMRAGDTAVSVNQQSEMLSTSSSRVSACWTSPSLSVATRRGTPPRAHSTDFNAFIAAVSVCLQAA
jgi:hypothetical protein